MKFYKPNTFNSSYGNETMPENNHNCICRSLNVSFSDSYIGRALKSC